MRPLVNNDATDPATEVSGAGVVLSLLQRRLVELHIGRFGTVVAVNALSISIREQLKNII